MSPKPALQTSRRPRVPTRFFRLLLVVPLAACGNDAGVVPTEPDAGADGRADVTVDALPDADSDADAAGEDAREDTDVEPDPSDGDPDVAPDSQDDADAEPPTCEDACAQVADCLVDLCDGFGEGERRQLSTACIDRCTPARAEELSSQTCDEIVAAARETSPAIAAACVDDGPPPPGPTLDEPFHMPTMTDISTLDVVVVEDWQINTITGTSRHKLINIHVDYWWGGVEIRVPVRLIAPADGPAEGFVISGANEPETSEGRLSEAEQAVIDGGVGVVQTRIKGLWLYPELPSEDTLLARFIEEDLDWRYSEIYLWSAIMMRSITAAFHDEVFLPGPVIAYGSSKNGITPLISCIHDERITAVRSTVAFTAYTPIRSYDPLTVEEVVAANNDFEDARDAGLPAGDQPWSYYDRGFATFDPALDAGWSLSDIQASLDRVADDLYVGENWDELVDRGVEIFSLPGSHDWVAYDVPSASALLPQLRTYIVPNGGHNRDGHPAAPSNDVNAAFFAEQLFGADGGLEIPDISTTVDGDTLDVTVTFPDGGVPEDSRIFWLYDRGPDGSSWYLYDLFPDDTWTTMTGAGSTWTASIPLESDRRSIDLVTTHVVTVGTNVVPISAPYTRVTLD